MPPEAKSKAKKPKQRASNEAVKILKVATGPDENEETAMPPLTTKSKCKARPKSRPKSATKHAMKRPKSRQTVNSKEKVMTKGNVAAEDGATMEQAQRDQVMAVLDAVLNSNSRSKSRPHVKERNASIDRMAKQNKTSAKAKEQPKSRGKNPATFQKIKTKSDKKCKRPKSRPKSRGHVLACKSSKCATARRKVSKSAGKVIDAADQVAGGPSQTTQSGNTTQIFILGSPNDPMALELLQSLVQKINTQAMAPEAKEEAPAGPPHREMYVTDQAQLEELYDAMYELTNNVRTIQDSYEKIINSLVNLQHRRKGKKEKASLIPATPSTTLKNQTTTGSGRNTFPEASPGSIARFMDPGTRNEAFADLFAQLDALKDGMAQFNSCFDESGFFDQAVYAQHQITPGQRQSWLTEIRSLAVTVDALLAEYNREVLDMFRIESNLGNN